MNIFSVFPPSQHLTSVIGRVRHIAPFGLTRRHLLAQIPSQFPDTPGQPGMPLPKSSGVLVTRPGSWHFGMTRSQPSLGHWSVLLNPLYSPFSEIKGLFNKINTLSLKLFNAHFYGTLKDCVNGTIDIYNVVKTVSLAWWRSGDRCNVSNVGTYLLHNLYSTGVNHSNKKPWKIPWLGNLYCTLVGKTL